MIEKALGYYFIFSGFSLPFLQEKGKEINDFFEDVLYPKNGNQLIIINKELVEAQLAEKDLRFWNLLLASLSRYKKILYMPFAFRDKNAAIEVFETEDNNFLKEIKTLARNRRTVIKPIIYIYTEETKIDSETNNLLFLNFDKIEQQCTFLENKKPRTYFSTTRKLSKRATTNSLAIQILNAKDKKVILQDPHLLHRKQFSVLVQMILDQTFCSCAEVILLTSDIDLIEKSDCNITYSAFQARALNRAKAQIKNSFSEFCKKTFKPKIYFYLCQLRSNRDSSFIGKNYASETKTWLRDKKAFIDGHLSCACSQTFLHSDDEPGVDCYVNYIDDDSCPDEEVQSNFFITPICLHGLSRDHCKKCR